jgi:hypothetical protein
MLLSKLLEMESQAGWVEAIRDGESGRLGYNDKYSLQEN